MPNCCNAVEHMYDERNKIIIIGLTGRTGSGCSTVAKILATENVDNLDLQTPIAHGYSDIDARKTYILDKYIRQSEKWMPFRKIDVSALILLSVFKEGKQALAQYIKNIQLIDNKIALRIFGPESIYVALDSIDDIFDDVHEISIKERNSGHIDVDFYTDLIIKYRNRFRSLLEQYQCYVIEKTSRHNHTHKKYNMYTYLMQLFANNLRASGNPFKEEFESRKYTLIPEKISKIIDTLRNETPEGKAVRICIDAIRNPYEAIYLRDKYKAFYLFSINTDEDSRLRRLSNLTKDEIDNLDKVEYGNEIDTPEKTFYHQNIQGCIEIANIHIHNKDVSNNKYYELTRQIVRYLALIQHPGLVTPTSIERCMQIAYNAKLNSGCLSRQVGAVVTRKDFSVQSVGWNDVPKGQVACNLRDVHDFCVNKDETMHSRYELENKDFLSAMMTIDKELTEAKKSNADVDFCTPYCFKDIYQGLTGEKNQVHTRALHAEENAFLQISKYGGTGVEGGYLFTTASPCELCSKKAYQLGISKIFYIDPYPGISKEHILSFGNNVNKNPQMVLFQGAVGESYIELYRPRIALKDEAEMRTGIKIKKVLKNISHIEDLDFKDIEYKNSSVELKFKSRTDIETKRVLKFIPKKTGLNCIYKTFEWTESSFDSIKLVEEESSEGLKMEVVKTDSPACYKIDFHDAKSSEEGYFYSLIIKAKDEKKTMEQTVEHIVRHKTDMLELKLIFPVDLIDMVDSVVYADFQGNVECKRENVSLVEKEGNQTDDTCRVYKNEGFYTVHEIIKNPCVNYKYALEWKFKKN